MMVRSAVRIALSLAVAVSSASAITIDNFEEGPFSLSTSTFCPGTSCVRETQSGLSTLNVISGERTVMISSSGAIETTADLALTAGDDAAVVSLSAGVTWFSYGFASPLDLTLGGTLDRFVVDITAASGNLGVGFNAYTSGGLFVIQVPVSGPGAITTLFSDFQPFILPGFPPPGVPPVFDPTQVSGLELFFQGDGSVSVSNIAAIPEPSTALLLALGLICMASRTRAHEHGHLAS